MSEINIEYTEAQWKAIESIERALKKAKKSGLVIDATHSHIFIFPKKYKNMCFEDFTAIHNDCIDLNSSVNITMARNYIN